MRLQAGASAIDERDFAEHTLRGLSSGVVATDRDGRVILANGAAARILGITDPNGVIGRSCREAFADYPEMAALLVEALGTRSPANRAELELRHVRDGQRTIGYTLCQVRDREGVLLGVAMLFKDLTRIEQVEEQARLKERLAALGQMAAGLAHEMRNPVAAIEIHAGLLSRAIDPRSTSQVESVAHILSEARRLSETIATCLDFVRPVDLLENRVAIEPILESVAAEGIAGTTQVVRDFEAAGAEVLGDPAQLRQALSNLVRNAREAAGPSGTVWLRTRVETPQAAEGTEDGAAARDAESSIVIEVADNGPGIPPEHRHRVFHPFFTTKPKGSGLGLAMVQKIVQGHRGRIDFVSRAGEGTTFRVVLRQAGVANR